METYLDNAATTKCHPEVARLMTQIMCEDYGNAASLHTKGIAAEQRLRSARESIAHFLKVAADEIIFTSGGTESDNLAIIGAAYAAMRRGKHIISSAIEHPAVAEALNYLEREGFRVTRLPVDGQGRVRVADLEGAIRAETILVSIMHVNNEMGSVQPIAAIGELLHKTRPQIIFHVDAVQGFGKIPVWPKQAHIGLLSASAHKIHGPKGVGLLYADKSIKLKPLGFGGGQQGGLRPGTENVPGSCGMAMALKMMTENVGVDMPALKKRLTDGLVGIPDVYINSPEGELGAPHIVNLSVCGVKSEVMVHALAEKNIFVSAGHACASHKPGQFSPSLRALGLDKERLESALRLSFSHYTTMEQIDYTLAAMCDIMPVLRRYARR